MRGLPYPLQRGAHLKVMKPFLIAGSVWVSEQADNAG
jgi:hypothetical protein